MKLLGLGVAICALVALTGCGGSTAGQSVSAGFKPDASRACSEAVPSTVAGPLTMSAFIRREQAGRPALARLARLHAPAGEEGTYLDMLRRLNQNVTFVKSHASQFVGLSRMSPGTTEYAAVTRLLRPIQDSLGVESADARALGLASCAIVRIRASVQDLQATSTG